MEIAEILSHTFSQKFRESNGFTEKNHQIVDLTKFFFSEREFQQFSHVHVKCDHAQKFP